MTAMTARTLNHFALFAGGERLWALSGEERERFLAGWLEDLARVAPRVELYGVYPARGEADYLVWSALPAAEPAAAGEFFTAFARATAPRRGHLDPGLTLWGFTRPSPYARRGSERAIDPLAGERERYLIVYPFTKTTGWYQLDADARQAAMNEHIKVGRQHQEIRQLLLYSFGLQDQEFVVVYETADLAAFSELVRELRGTEARRFTERDTPIVTAVHQDHRTRTS